MTSSSTSTSTTTPLHLTIRFSNASIPDLPLTINPSPSTPTQPHFHSHTPTQIHIHHLKYTIRAYLPPKLAERALRLIHAGRVLEDAWTVQEALRLRLSSAAVTGFPSQAAQVARRERDGDGAAPVVADRKGKGRVRVSGVVQGEGDGDGEGNGERTGDADKLQPTHHGEGSAPNEEQVKKWLHDTVQKDSTPSNIFTRIYIHCSVSPSSLTAEEMAAELSVSFPDASNLTQTNTSALGVSSTTSSFSHPPSNDTHARRRRDSAHTLPAARGFDRLLHTAGFTAEDVEGFRVQFRGIVEGRHTPDTMPSPDTLLGMEERWLDNAGISGSGAGVGRGAGSGSEGARAADGAAAGAGGGFEDDEDSRAQMYDTLIGVCTGFFWPLAAVVWGLREDGVWSRRRAVSVLAGLGINLGFGIVRVLG